MLLSDVGLGTEVEQGFDARKRAHQGLVIFSHGPKSRISHQNNVSNAFGTKIL